MKIVTYPHDMGIGGSQLNAVELAAALQRRGHEVLVFGQQGPLVEKVSELGLEFLESPAVHRRPTPGVVNALRRLVKTRGIDVVHGYEWPPSLEAVLACRPPSRAVAVSTVLSMSVAPFIPTNVPLLVGTEQILANEKAFGRTRVGLLEPPVDTILNGPGLDLGLAAFRQRWGLDPAVFTVTVVSRLAHEMKLEGLLAAMGAIQRLNTEFPVQLVVVGAGPAAAEVRRNAEHINHLLGHRRIVLTGELPDPRPAYATADVSLGMGGSALRAMAFEKPLVVQGENGYWRLLTPETVSEFMWQGWYGSGPGKGDAVERLAGYLRTLHGSVSLRQNLGQFARETVCNRFSLAGAAASLEEFYCAAMIPGDGAGVRFGRSVESLRRFAAYKLARVVPRAGGGPARDDFNARPVAAALVSGRKP
ncbi:glycosyltransferase [Arthrobacter wenxiniae]|jgi:glycosyltransferase involved in cell wall biosynthesis|uniref:D-inositol 3-phosphate glycosyltransferase n=1 Tax=Arthrobacter wenxiniae TaxID=2713570 RepID=A0A7Y7LXI6_9MICC|nr:glycosyltransferase [Arthrobacter wenxiniae]NVM94405.1 glycosyltransferase family 4 protein [Arthrobacter wenxiniae]